MTELAALVEGAGRRGLAVDDVVATRAHVGLRTNSRWFAVAADDVVEVIALPTVTRVPAAPAHVLGVALVRSRLVSLVDLEQLLAGQPTPRSERGRIAVVRADGLELGLVAMATRGLLALPDDGATEVAPAERPPWIAREVGHDGLRLAVLDVAALAALVARGARP
jgi:chemotaxis signal transduction protein